MGVRMNEGSAAQGDVSRCAILGRSVLAALFSLAALEGRPASAKCPSGEIVFVTHIADGRSKETNEQLSRWFEKMSDRDLAERLRAAFHGKICKDDPALLTALAELASCSFPNLRAEAVHVLSRVLERRAAQTVVDALRDESTMVRLRALSGIAYACDKASLPAVEGLIAREKSKDVLQYAREVADRLSGNLPCAPITISDSAGSSGHRH